MSDLSMYEIPLSSCVNESNRNINDANFVRKWFGGKVAFYLQEGINYKEHQYNVVCFDKYNNELFVGVVYRFGKSWKYRTPYCWKDGGQIKSNKKFSSIIKATRSMTSRLNIVNILDSLNCCNSGLYVWV
jgi:hypothetical protein